MYSMTAVMESSRATLPEQPSVRRVHFKALTPDSGLWRIDWIGGVTFPIESPRVSQPSIEVSISSVEYDPEDPSVLERSMTTPALGKRRVSMPIGALPVLAIGDIWRDGWRLASPDYVEETFRGVSIAPTHESNHFIKAGLSIDGAYVLPLAQHPWHIDHTKSYCVCVNLADSRRVVIPCMELIRFYFGSSSRLIHVLFGGVADDRLWEQKEFDSAAKRLRLKLASGIKGSSAADVGRIALSDHARRAAKMVYSTCMAHGEARRVAYPYVGFPFLGKTDLKATGRWLPFGSESNRTFVVCRLRSCSHPFPFRSLWYEPHEKARTSSAKSGGTGGDDQATMDGRGSPLSDGDPSSARTRRSYQMKGESRFPDLERKQVRCERIVAAPADQAFRRRRDGTLEEISFGEGRSGGTAREADFHCATTSAADKIHEIPVFVLHAMEELKAQAEGVTVSLADVPGVSARVFPLPYVHCDSETDDVDVICQFDEGNGEIRRRRACVLQIETPGTAGTHFMGTVEGQRQGEEYLGLQLANCSLLELVEKLIKHSARDEKI